jgi:hypothetical protein
MCPLGTKAVGALGPSQPCLCSVLLPELHSCFSHPSVAVCLRSLFLGLGHCPFSICPWAPSASPVCLGLCLSRAEGRVGNEHPLVQV